MAPSRADLPSRYHHLLDWYLSEYARPEAHRAADPILQLRGVGQALWVGEDPDAYVRRLREGWA